MYVHIYVELHILLNIAYLTFELYKNSFSFAFNILWTSLPVSKYSIFIFLASDLL